MKRGAKNTMIRGLNLALYLSFCLLLGTGALLYWRLVPGSEGGRGLAFYGWSRHEWGDVHFWTGAVFLVATVVHLYVHRLWLRKIAGAASIWWVWLGLSAGVGLVALFVVLPLDELNRGNRSEPRMASSGAKVVDAGGRKGRRNKKQAEKNVRAAKDAAEDGTERRKRLRHRGGRS